VPNTTLARSSLNVANLEFFFVFKEVLELGLGTLEVLHLRDRICLGVRKM